MTVKVRKENCRLMEGAVFQLRDLMHPVEHSPKEYDGNVITRDAYRHKQDEKYMI